MDEGRVRGSTSFLVRDLALVEKVELDAE